jgi:hypothetical protein
MYYTSSTNILYFRVNAQGYITDSIEQEIHPLVNLNKVKRIVFVKSKYRFLIILFSILMKYIDQYSFNISYNSNPFILLQNKMRKKIIDQNNFSIVLIPSEGKRYL